MIDMESKELTLNVREQLIISQALYVAIEALEKEEHPQYSNIEDMERLADTKFSLWGAVKMAQDNMHLLDELNKDLGKDDS